MNAGRAIAPGALQEFQNGFIGAVYGIDDALLPPAIRALAAQPGFSVYRNTIIKGCIDALQGNYPTVERLVGTDWFRAAAALHVRAAPPSDVRLFAYGSDFPDFLAGFEPARELPYLADVARLDQLWMEAHVAADGLALKAAEIASLPPLELGRMMLRPHVSARWKWFEAQPIYTIWSANREERTLGDDLDWQGEGALIVRTGDVVQWRPIDAGGCAFLDACAEGQSLKAAANYALQIHPALDISQMMSDFILAGAFASLATTPSILSGSP